MARVQPLLEALPSEIIEKIVEQTTDLSLRSLGQTCHLFRQFWISRKYREWSIWFDKEADRSWLDTYLTKHPAEYLAKVHKLTVRMWDFTLHLPADTIAVENLIGVWQTLLDLFISMHEVKLLFSLSRNHLHEVASSTLWRRQADLWSRLPNPLCDFHVRFSVEDHYSGVQILPYDLLQPLQSLSVVNLKLVTSSLTGVGKSVVGPFLSDNLPANLTRSKNISLQLPLQGIDLLQRTTLRASAITTITTCIFGINDFQDLLGILGRVAHTLRKLVLDDYFEDAREMSSPSKLLVAVHLPRLRSLECRGYDMFKLGLKYLGMPSISTIHLKLDRSFISTCKAESLRYLGIAKALKTVCIECEFAEIDGEDLAKLLFQVKEALRPSINYSILLTFEDTSWLCEVVKPHLQQYLLPIMDYIVYLSEDLHQGIMTEEMAAQERALPRLGTHKLSVEINDDAVGSLQQRFDRLSLPCMKQLEVHAYWWRSDGTREHPFDPELLEKVLACLWNRFPAWPSLEVLDFNLNHAFDEELVYHTSATDEIGSACHRLGVQWQWQALDVLTH